MRIPGRLRTPLRTLGLVALLIAGIAQTAFVARAIGAALPSDVYWTRPDQARAMRDVAALKSIVPVLEQLQVRDYESYGYRQISYAGGAFSSDPRRFFPEPLLPFTPQAQADFDRIGRALRAGGVWVIIIGADYESDGHLAHAEFVPNTALLDFYHWSYLYQTRPGNLPAPDFYMPIEGHWYLQWEDWI